MNNNKLSRIDRSLNGLRDFGDDLFLFGLVLVFYMTLFAVIRETAVSGWWYAISYAVFAVMLYIGYKLREL